MEVLHITDFHLDNPGSSDEFLRLHHYRDFIDSLLHEIKSEGHVPSILVASGDFINKGNYSNFDHARNVIDYFAKKAEISSESVFICAGNHDVKYPGGICDDSEYQKFKRIIVKNHPLSSTRLYDLYVSSGTYILTLNPTLIAVDHKTPPPIPNDDIDQIMSQVIRDKVPLDAPLIVVSHYPMHLYGAATYLAEEAGWAARHYWGATEPLVRMIEQYRQDDATVWLFGDGHFPDSQQRQQNRNSISIMTGMLGGTPAEKQKYNTPSQANLISMKADTIHLKTFRHEPKGYHHVAFVGKWKSETNSFVIKRENVKSEKKLVQVSLNGGDDVTELIGTSSQDSINEIATLESIYQIGKFKCNENSVSLGWINVTALMNSKGLLNQSVEKAAQWLEKILVPRIEPEVTAFLGLDYWGSVLAALTGIRTGCNSFSIATRGEGKYHSLHERMEHVSFELLERVPKVKTIVIYTDVVATGATISNVKTELESLVGKKFPIEKWITISVLSDKNINRNQYLSGFHKIGTLCQNIPLPILSARLLPNDLIIQPTIDLR